MSTAPLPSQIDIRKLAVKGTEIKAEVPVSSLVRISDMLANDSGSIDVSLQFYIDDERFRRVDGELSGSVAMLCQRCLDPVMTPIDTKFELAVVWSETDAERLPKSLEPLIVGEELSDLSDVVTEELILCIPFVNYHAEGACEQPVLTGVVDDLPLATDDTGLGQGGKENPFQVLEKLKQGKE